MNAVKRRPLVKSHTTWLGWKTAACITDWPPACINLREMMKERCFALLWEILRWFVVMVESLWRRQGTLGFDLMMVVCGGVAR